MSLQVMLDRVSMMFTCIPVTTCEANNRQGPFSQAFQQLMVTKKLYASWTWDRTMSLPQIEDPSTPLFSNNPGRGFEGSSALENAFCLLERW